MRLVVEFSGREVSGGGDGERCGAGTVLGGGHGEVSINKEIEPTPNPVALNDPELAHQVRKTPLPTSPSHPLPHRHPPLPPRPIQHHGRAY